MPQPIEHQTPRLHLRFWQDRHIAPFAALNADPEVMRYFPALQTEAQTRATVAAWQTHFDEHGFSNWAVELKSTGEFIGFVGLTVPRRQLPFSPCVEIGWRLARQHWGQGCATEAARACLRLGFELFDLAEIVSFTALLNRPSRRVMERIGLLNTGRDFDHPALTPGHALQRHCLYAISQQGWQQG